VKIDKWDKLKDFWNLKIFNEAWWSLLYHIIKRMPLNKEKKKIIKKQQELGIIRIKICFIFWKHARFYNYWWITWVSFLSGKLITIILVQS
jgi:hypothetical protein